MNDIEVIPASASLMRAEIDSQIATAHAFPRDIGKARARAIEIATGTQEVAEDFRFALRQGGELVTGISIRGAEILACAYGNLRVAGSVTEINRTHVHARAYAHDLETNMQWAEEVVRSIVGSRGRYSENMIQKTAGAAVSIACRNATLRVIPRSFSDPVDQAALRVAQGAATSAAVERDKVLRWLAKLWGIDDERACFAVGVETREEVGLEEVALLKQMATSVREGHQTVEQAFPPLASKPTSAVQPEDERKQAVGDRVAAAVNAEGAPDLMAGLDDPGQ